MRAEAISLMPCMLNLQIMEIPLSQTIKESIRKVLLTILYDDYYGINTVFDCYIA
jgi:hypothetical protein